MGADVGRTCAVLPVQPPCSSAQAAAAAAAAFFKGEPISAPSGWSCTPSFPTVTCTSSALAVGASATIQVTTSLPATAASGTVLTDTATVAESGGVTDPVAGNNSTTPFTATFEGLQLFRCVAGTAPAEPAAGSFKLKVEQELFRAFGRPDKD